MRSCCVAQGDQLDVLWWPGEMGYREGREVKEGGDVCIIMADLHCFRAETQHGKDF